MKVLITGGTGLLGGRLTELLQAQGHEVAYLSRSEGYKNGIRLFRWDISGQTIDPEAIAWATHVVHLAGAGVADSRWTPARKEEILKSRTESTKLLGHYLKQTGRHVQAVVAASATGFYGAGNGTPKQETDAPGDDFLAKVCIAWEEAIHQMDVHEARKAIIRIGVVLSQKGGALPKMAMPVKLFVGAPLGNGEQYIPWIHIDDLSKLFLAALENPVFEGTYNGVAPKPVTNAQLTEKIAQVMKRPLLPLPVPAFALKMALGEMSEVVLSGVNASASKVESTGFVFDYPDIRSALTDLLGKA
jgi:uncharacterized protein (TIGR01777 family)